MMMKSYLSIFLFPFLFFFQATNSVSAQCVGNCQNGIGTFTFPNGAKYEGQWQNNKSHGKGKLTYATGDVYEGTFEQGFRSGYAVYNHKNGDVFKGYYVQDSRTEGTLRGRDGREYRGQFKANKFSGEGTLFNPDGSVAKSGIWLEGKLDEKSTNSEFEKSVGGRTFAVIVGVSQYAIQSANLRYADSDAKKFAEILKSKYGVPEKNLVLLTNENATHASIKNALQEVFRRASSKDRIIFYFSGHGDKGLLLPHDFNGMANGLTHAELKQYFRKSPAQYKICIADACHAGSARQKYFGVKKTFNGFQETIEPIEEDEMPDTPNDSYDKALPPISAQPTQRSVIAMMASRAEQTAKEDPQLQQGIFTYFLLKALNGESDVNTDGRNSVFEIYSYVRKGVMQRTGNQQIPIVFGKFNLSYPLIK